MTAAADWTWDEHRDAVLALVRDQERGLGPGEDWAPVLLLDGDHAVIQVPVGLMDLTALKDTARDVIAGLGARYEARWYARVQTVWMVATAPDAPRRPEGDVAADPARTESILVLLGEQGSDREELWMAPVYRPRRRSRPKLGPWEQASMKEPRG